MIHKSSVFITQAKITLTPTLLFLRLYNVILDSSAARLIYLLVYPHFLITAAIVLMLK